MTMTIAILRRANGLPQPFRKSDLVKGFVYGNHPDDVARCLKDLRALGYIKNAEGSRIRYVMTRAGKEALQTPAHVANTP